MGCSLMGVVAERVGGVWVGVVKVLGARLKLGVV